MAAKILQNYVARPYVTGFCISMQSFLLSVGEKFIPILKESKFKETGRLTPEEFVFAGDYLVFKCPTWSWSAGEESKIRSFLPANKQFLITKNVPAIPFETLSQLHENHDFNDSLDQFQNIETGNGQIIQEIVCHSVTEEITINNNGLVDLDNIPDLEDFENQNLLITDDPATHVESNIRVKHDNQRQQNFVHTQTYDLYITYDKFYQTPRMWISGYDTIGIQLSPETVLNLISQDHAHKTVTVEAFPHLSIDLASVHPCKHAAVMKKIIDQYSTAEKDIRVDQYVVIFLKFMSSIMPSVDYDHTMTME